MKHIMCDLETMSAAKDAAIVAIGAVRFDLEKNQIGDSFYRTINLKSAQRAGGRVDADTVMWWMKQSPSAREAITGDDSVLIETALKDFSAWVREIPTEHIWGNGSDFDNVILEGAYVRLGWTAPWSYRMNRCYRTMFSSFPGIEREKFAVGQYAHHALHDAVSQAKHLCQIWEKIHAPR